MENKGIYAFSFAALALLVATFITFWDDSQPFANQMGWVLKQLPEVKSVEYLEALKKS
jgi:hypothetical protein